MARFNDRNRGRGGRSGGQHRDRGSREMFEATCSNCGKIAKVPFKPTGEKPVYCSDCFEIMGGDSDRKSNSRGYEERQSGRGNRGGERGSFRENRSSSSHSHEQLSNRLDILESKIDILLGLLEPLRLSVSDESTDGDSDSVTFERKRNVRAAAGDSVRLK